MADPIDYSDPCALLALLRPAYYSLIAGSRAETIEFSNAQGVSRRVTYSKVNLADLRAEIARLEDACSRLNPSARPKRYAIIGGNWCPGRRYGF